MKIIGIIISIGVGFLVVKNYSKIKQKITSFLTSQTTTNQEDATTTHSKKESQYDKNIAKEEFIHKSGSFSGIYEAFYQVAKGTSLKSKEVIAEWNTRIHYLNSCSNVQQLWTSLFENHENMTAEQQKQNASLWLGFLRTVGIERENRNLITIDATTRFRYYTLNGEEMIIGITMKVMLPCWVLDDKILEKGILTI
jgi:hypothetical protein